MFTRRAISLLAVAGVLSLLLVIGLPVPASAATTCTFDRQTSVVDVSLEAGERWAAAVAADGAIVLSSESGVVDCGEATRRNTHTVRVRGPVGDVTWFGIRHNGEGGAFPSSLTFDIDLGTADHQRPLDKLTIVGRRVADVAHSVFDEQTGQSTVRMNGTTAVVHGRFKLRVALLGGADEHVGEPARVNGGAGDDKIRMAGWSLWDPVLVGGRGDDRLDAFGAEIRGGRGNDHITGNYLEIDAGLGDDFIRGQDLFVEEGPRPNVADTMIGNDLDDFISYLYRTGDVTIRLDDKPNDGEAGEGDNIIDFLYFDLGNGDDLVVGSAADEVFYLWAGTDRARGGGGIDVFSGEGHHTVWGGRGPDSFDVFAGVGTFYGGPGRDGFSGAGVYDPSQPAYEGADQAFGGVGNDRFEMGCGNDIAVGGPGNDRLSVGTTEADVGVCADADQARGGDGDDWITGGQDDDALFGGAAVDVADGGSGNDICRAETKLECEPTALLRISR